jgi:putative oxidoreductase
VEKIDCDSADLITVPLRLALGVIFIAHGSDIVFGAFGGKGLAAFTSGQTPFGFMQPAWLWLGMAAFSQLVGGVLVLLGLFTRLALLIAFVMLTAMFGVHLKSGFFCRRDLNILTRCSVYCAADLRRRSSIRRSNAGDERTRGRRR